MIIAWGPLLALVYYGSEVDGDVILVDRDGGETRRLRLEDDGRQTVHREGRKASEAEDDLEREQS